MINSSINNDVVNYKIRCVGVTKEIRICCLGRCACGWGGEFLKPVRFVASRDSQPRPTSQLGSYLIL